MVFLAVVFVYFFHLNLGMCLRFLTKKKRTVTVCFLLSLNHFASVMFLSLINHLSVSFFLLCREVGGRVLRIESKEVG